QARADRHAVRADRQALGLARRSAPQRLRRPPRNARPRQDDPRAGAAGRPRRRAPAQARRPAASRPAHAGIARVPGLFTGGDRKPARPRYSRAPPVFINHGGGIMKLKNALLGATLAGLAVAASAQDKRPDYGPSVTITQAKKIAAGVVAECTKNHWNVAVAIVDPHGFLVYFER